MSKPLYFYIDMMMAAPAPQHYSETVVTGGIDT